MIIEDRAYQQRAIVDAREAFARGKRAVLLYAPTGAGKTTIAGCIAKAAVARGKRIAFLAHRKELIDQAASRFRQFGLTVGVQGYPKNAPVQVTSPQIILSRRELPEADLTILDEARHYVSPAFGRIPQTYLAAGTRLLGLDATPERADGIGLGELFDHLVVVAQIRDLTELGFLVPCRVKHPFASPRALALEPTEAFERFAAGRSTVVFAPHVKAAEDFARAFTAKGIPAGVVEGTMADEERELVLDRFARGDLPVVVNVMVLTEGWDCPRAKVCILARRVGSPSLYLQMVGRVLRPYPGDSDALLLDLAGNVDMHGEPDEERLWSLTGVASVLASQVRDGVRFCRTCKAEIPKEVAACPLCGREPPAQETPRGEGIELVDAAERRAERQAERASLPEDKRLRILQSLYVKNMRRANGKRVAHHAYKGMTGNYPDARLSEVAWRAAQAEAAGELPAALEVDT